MTTQNESTISITQERYESLLRSERVLDALEAGGVDNWEWYYESLQNAGVYDDEDEL